MTMSLVESSFGVWLRDRRAGTLHRRGDFTWFVFNDDYRSDPQRPVLGLVFEQDLTARQHPGHRFAMPWDPAALALRLPPWFSNLLPEGPLRQWIADDRGVSADREMELLAQVGHDLPGAVQVIPEGDVPSLDVGRGHDEEIQPATTSPRQPAGWRFSLAGVGLKFSMVAKDDRLTLPAFGEGGDWIVKMPDRIYPEVPRNEFTMMSLAGASGIEVPPVRLVHRDEIDGIPDNVWPASEEWAYAVRRFDRDERRGLVHIEDLAQVRNVYPDQKYTGSFQTVASLVYRRHDLPALAEFARRLAFIVLISNGDAHLKNWSLIYRDPRSPTLSPAYDLVSTAPYRLQHGPEDLGLRLFRSKRFSSVTLSSFARLQDRLGATDADLVGTVVHLVDEVRAHWPEHSGHFVDPALRDAVAHGIEAHRKTLLAGAARS
jgi:serine/threonine-protein kinase HipA